MQATKRLVAFLRSEYKTAMEAFDEPPNSDYRGAKGRHDPAALAEWTQRRADDRKTRIVEAAKKMSATAKFHGLYDVALAECLSVPAVLEKLEVVRKGRRELINAMGIADYSLILLASGKANDAINDLERFSRATGTNGSARKRATGKATPGKSGLTVKVNVGSWTVFIDDKHYTLNSEQAVRWVKVLADHRGQLISGPKLSQFDKELIDPRTDRLFELLPKPVQSLLETVPKKGTRMKLA